jgi:methylase of polypeptide subunit release factors
MSELLDPARQAPDGTTDACVADARMKPAHFNADGRADHGGDNPSTDASPAADGPLTRRQQALRALGSALLARGYRFTCPTPDTQAIVAARKPRARDLRDVFGWSRPFAPDLLPSALLSLLRQADAVSVTPDGLVSRVRYSTFGDALVVHSVWPTTAGDAVFFGPDTYRFAQLIARTLDQRQRDRPLPPPRAVVDLGCGTGAGGILAARLLPPRAPTRVLFTDINDAALELAAVNASLAGLSRFTCLHSDLLSAVPDPIDLVLANPPYLLDPEQRVYRHGGGTLGIGLSVRIVEQALQRLAPGGLLVLYTAAPIVDGRDLLWAALAPIVARAGLADATDLRYAEIDPDVFGAELTSPAYAQVERISVVGLTLQRPLDRGTGRTRRDVARARPRTTGRSEFGGESCGESVGPADLGDPDTPGED